MQAETINSGAFPRFGLIISQIVRLRNKQYEAYTPDYPVFQFFTVLPFRNISSADKYWASYTRDARAGNRVGLHAKCPNRF
jgi:hypothetical protein